ncbi:MAG: hypothetical protein JWQ11_3059 [Rhizobacter sp.]|nr:hypothetical protein [Rhizobacter sp.]
MSYSENKDITYADRGIDDQMKRGIAITQQP